MSSLIKEYMFATKIAENSYEAFQALSISTEYPKQKRMFEKIENVLLNNSITSINATKMENVALGSVYNGSMFTLPEVMDQDWNFDAGMPEINIMGQPNNVFVFLDNNVVFLVLVNPEGSADGEKLTAAFTNEVIIVKLGEEEVVPYGAIWNGSSWSI